MMEAAAVLAAIAASKVRNSLMPADAVLNRRSRWSHASYQPDHVSNSLQLCNEETAELITQASCKWVCSLGNANSKQTM